MVLYSTYIQFVCNERRGFDWWVMPTWCYPSQIGRYSMRYRWLILVWYSYILSSVLVGWWLSENIWSLLHFCCIDIQLHCTLHYKIILMWDVYHSNQCHGYLEVCLKYSNVCFSLSRARMKRKLRMKMSRRSWWTRPRVKSSADCVRRTIGPNSVLSRISLTLSGPPLWWVTLFRSLLSSVSKFLTLINFSYQFTKQVGMN